jgi:hypothetical protein
VADRTGLPRREVYQLALRLKKEDEDDGDDGCRHGRSWIGTDPRGSLRISRQASRPDELPQRAAAEGQVEGAYLRTGYRLRNRRWRGGVGEIDLVMERLARSSSWR